MLFNFQRLLAADSSLARNGRFIKSLRFDLKRFARIVPAVKHMSAGKVAIGQILLLSFSEFHQLYQPAAAEVRRDQIEVSVRDTRRSSRTQPSRRRAID